MIRAVFTVENGIVTGVNVNGHAGFSGQGSDIVCAAVSSAAYMAANTITDVQQLACSVSVDDGFLQIKLSPDEAKQAQVILNGLLLHFNALSQEYAEYIDLKISEV